MALHSPWDLQSDDEFLPDVLPWDQYPGLPATSVGTEEHLSKNPEKAATPASTSSSSTLAPTAGPRHAQSWVDTLKSIFKTELKLLQDLPPVRLQTACSGTGCPVMGLKALSRVAVSMLIAIKTVRVCGERNNKDIVWEASV